VKNLKVKTKAMKANKLNTKLNNPKKAHI